MDALDLLLLQAHLPRNCHRQFAHASLMARRVGVARLDRVRNGADGLLQAFLQYLRVMLVLVCAAVALGPGPQSSDAKCQVACELGQQFDFLAARGMAALDA